MAPSNSNDGKGKTITSANDDKKSPANENNKASADGTQTGDKANASASALVSAWLTRHIHNSEISRHARLYNALRTELPVLIERLERAKTQAQFREAVQSWMRDRIEGGPIGRHAPVLRALRDAVLKLEGNHQ